MRMMLKNKLGKALSAAVLILPLVTPLASARTPEDSPHVTQANAPTDIRLSYKRDIRDVDSFRGIGPWSTSPLFAGVAAQDTVEVRAEGVDASGRPSKISPDWSTSDPEMVTVSPSQGDDVKITVHKVGESRVKITDQGFSKELVVRAKYEGKFFLFEISPPPPAKPLGPAATEINPALKGQKELISYAAGMRLAKTLRAQLVDVDPDLLSQAMKDVLAGRPTLMNYGQAQMALNGLDTELNVTEAMVLKKKIAEKNKEDGEKFLAENRNKDGVVTLPSGLQYKVVKEGSGKKPGSLDVAVCQYTGKLIDGMVFDDSHRRKDGGQASFPVRAVIKGWQEALKLMPAGSEWQIFVPPDLAYGEHGMPQANIPPNAALVFDVELLSVREPSSSAPTSTAASTPEQAVTPDIIEAIRKMVEKETEQKHNDNN